jgi:AraC-type transcriptional regulator N-terminus
MPLPDFRQASRRSGCRVRPTRFAKPAFADSGLKSHEYLVRSVHLPSGAFAAEQLSARNKRIVPADRVFDNHTGEYVVVPFDLPVTSHVTEASEDAPFLAAALKIKPELVATLLLEAGSDDRGSDEALVIAVSRAPAELLDAVVRLLRLLDRPSDIPILRPMIEREIVWRLLCGDQSGLVRQIGLAVRRRSTVIPRSHGHEPAAVPETDPAAGSALTSHGVGRRRRQRRFSCGLRQPVPIQSRICAFLRRAARRRRGLARCDVFLRPSGLTYRSLMRSRVANRIVAERS